MLGERLKELRINLDLNMKQAAEKLGIPYTTYVGYEKNEREPNSETLVKLADFYNCSVDYLIGNTIRLNFIPHEIEDCEITCPICDYNYVHFVRTLMVKFPHMKSCGIAIEFSCEDGHTFYTVIETYKGNTYIVNTDSKNNILGYTSFISEDNVDDIYNLTEINIIEKYRTLDEYGKKAVDDLLNNEYERCQSEKKLKVIQLPMSELKVSAGTGNWLENNSYDSIEVIDTPLSRKADLVIEISGNSMEPTYHDGDNVLVRLQPSIDIGEIGVFVKDSEGYIKELGNNCLISHNINYPNISLNEYSDIRCIGKVIGRAEIVE